MDRKKDDLPHFSTLAEVNAEWLFGNENINWKFCNEHATFAHKEACEFIIHCGDKDFTEGMDKRMKDFGCTPAFRDAYLLAAASGAVRVLFWA